MSAEAQSGLSIEASPITAEEIAAHITLTPELHGISLADYRHKVYLILVERVNERMSHHIFKELGTALTILLPSLSEYGIDVTSDGIQRVIVAGVERYFDLSGFGDVTFDIVGDVMKVVVKKIG
jgi:hypothetical protein